MSLTEQQMQKVRDYMAAKRLNTVCPSCGSRVWGIDHIVPLPILRPDGMMTDEYPVPALMLVCQNCAYLRFFAAKPIGIAT